VLTRIVVANDGSAGGFKALGLACDIAKRYGAALHMISVEELPDFPASIDEIVEIKDANDHKYSAVIERARSMAMQAAIEFDAEVIAGHAVASIVAGVKRLNADLLVVGFMGHSALYDRIIGGTADRLVRLAPCPVLVVK
jgi:nucleotide-binding universal stress UspA family protein